MCKCPKLREIDFNGMPLNMIEVEAFSHLTNLEHLQISYTNENDGCISLNRNDLAISTVVDSFYLQMEYTKIAHFAPGFLQKISFFDSNIEHIPEDAFREIFEIFAQKNTYTLRKVPVPSSHINFGRNPLRCDCGIKWIVEDSIMMGVIEWPNMFNHSIATCRDGTPRKDLDPLIFEELCP